MQAAGVRVCGGPVCLCPATVGGGAARCTSSAASGLNLSLTEQHVELDMALCVPLCGGPAGAGVLP